MTETAAASHSRPRAGPVLLAVAHGSREPAAQRCIRALATRAGRLMPGITVRVAFVSHAQPRLDGALAQAVAHHGADRVVIVPLLLSSGYHLSTDIGAAAHEAGVAAAGPLGPSADLTAALADRLAEAAVPAGAPVVLAAAGSSDPRAAGDTARQAALLARRLGVPVEPAFASAAEPSVEQAVAALSARTGQPVAVASYLLAPGLFHGRLQQAGAAWASAPLGDHPAVAQVMAARYREAAATGAGGQTADGTAA